jgi:hypothetical protein
MVSAHATTLFAGPVKSGVDVAVSFAQLGGPIAAPAPARTVAVDPVAVDLPRDRSVLFQVFRI